MHVERRASGQQNPGLLDRVREAIRVRKKVKAVQERDLADGRSPRFDAPGGEAYAGVPANPPIVHCPIAPGAKP